VPPDDVRHTQPSCELAALILGLLMGRAMEELDAVNITFLLCNLGNDAAEFLFSYLPR
jgi:hypothetical protein